MNRRIFIQLTSLPLLAMINCQNKVKTNKFAVEIQSDMQIGHILLDMQNLKSKKIKKKEYLIVGGGVAGITSAYQLKKEDFVLCELSNSLGGSSSAYQYQETLFAQGAHYDLTYPQYFGEDVLKFLEDLKLIQWNSLTHYWDFVDKQYIIDDAKEGQAFVNRKIQSDVLTENEDSIRFLDFMEQFIEKIKAPTRLIDKDLHYLNKISFFQFLKQNQFLSNELLRSIDYQILDDFGGNSTEVAALAGIYYYGARPYLGEHNVVFSPPEGNYYFIKKMMAHIPKANLLTNHLVTQIQKTQNGFDVTVLDTIKKEMNLYQVQKIIYAGQKHAVKYIFPQDKSLFAQNTYAPWLVMNMVLNKNFTQEGFWQNEIISQDRTFLGFVDSNAQFTDREANRVLTAYFCFPPFYRKKLSEIKNYDTMIEYVLIQISDYFEIKTNDLKAKVEKIFIKVMGHAMPIPQPHYLLDDKNAYRAEKKLVYAGVDNARLPIFLEAVDSALEAIRLINDNAKST